MPIDEEGFASTNFVESSKVDISDLDRDALQERYRLERDKRATKDRAATVELIGEKDDLEGLELISEQR